MNSSKQIERKNDSNRWWSISAQFIATTFATLLSVDGMFISTVPTIVIPVLMGIPNQHNSNEYLTITAEQASWLASLGGLMRPLGSILSAVLSDKFGRKRSMILVNIPLLFGWYVLYRATTLWEIFAGFIILKVSISLSVVPHINFIGEICAPETRSTLIAYASIVASLSDSLIYILNTLIPWRLIALVSMGVPVLSFISLCFIPETPQWLLSKGRVSDAEKSLRWFRGWASSEEVSETFLKMQRINEKTNQELTDSSPDLFKKIAEFKLKRTKQPFIILSICTILCICTGAIPMHPFIVQIFKAYDSPIEPDHAVALLSLSTLLASIVFICAVRFTGKRFLYLTTVTGTFLSSLVIACYGFIYLPSGYTSFEQQNHTFNLENKNLAYIPLVFLFIKNFFMYAGVLSVPQLFLYELFSFKARGMACGVFSALNCILVFLSTKTYYNLEMMLSMQGASMLFCVLTGVGLIVMYFILPETEGRTLEDIETHFSDDSTKITDWKITKIVERNAGYEERGLLK